MKRQVKIYEDSALGIVTSGGDVVQGNHIAITANYTAADTRVIVADASAAEMTITLPAVVSTRDRIYIIKKIDASNNVVVDGNGSETIDGAATVTMATQWDKLTVMSTGTEWITL